MTIFKILPNELFYFVLIAGIIGSSVLKFLPEIAYTKLLKIISGTLVLGGIYFIGGIHTNESWNAKVVELELKLAHAIIESTKTNAVIETKVITKTNTIREKGENIIQYIDKEVVKYDSSCVIPKEFIDSHNKAGSK